MSKELKVVSTRIPEKLHNQMMEEIEASNYIGKSEFIRNAIINQINEKRIFEPELLINDPEYPKQVIDWSECPPEVLESLDKEGKLPEEAEKYLTNNDGG